MESLPLQLSSGQRVVEIARPWALFALYLFFAWQERWLIAVLLAFGVCLSAFVQMHDSLHASLGLSKRAHSFLLSISGLLLLKSGHALMVTHLRHHGRCLGEDDPEGKPATWPLAKVLIEGPFHMLTLRLDALRIAPRTKRLQLVETALTALILIVAVLIYVQFGSLIGLVYWAVAAFVSAGMPLWAAYIPHRLAPRNPARLAVARMARFWWTPAISSLAFHHVHHAFPKVPTALLPLAARSLGPREMDAIECAADHDH